MDSEIDPAERVEDLIRAYGAEGVSTSYFLCQRHEPSAIAYRIIGPDLAATPITYAELDSESSRLASAMAAMGCGPGDRVATLMGKGREFLVVLQAIWRLGAVHVPLFTAFASPAISLRLRASGCRLVFCDADQHPKLIGIDLPIRVVRIGQGPLDAICYADLLAAGGLRHVPIVLGPDDPLIQIYTSGTTGMPKGVIVPKRALASFHVYMEMSLRVSRDDVFWNAADPGWAYGLYYGVVGTFLTGANSVLVQGAFSAELFRDVLENFRITNFAAAPTVYRALRASSTDFTGRLALRRASSAGEPLTPDVNEWAAKKLGVQIHDHYGQTETGMTICNHHHPALHHEPKEGSMGRSMPGWCAQVLKEASDEVEHGGSLGRVAMDLTRSPLSWFDGYDNDPEKSAVKFSKDRRWYLTGDLARRDEEGEFFFASRDDDIIIMAGYRIGPFEVESVLGGHPSIAECSVIGMPDEMRGEVLEAAVVLHKGVLPTSELTLELQNWVRANYAAHAYPRRIHYLECLPKTPSGKVQRFVIRQMVRLLDAGECS